MLFGNDPLARAESSSLNASAEVDMQSSNSQESFTSAVSTNALAFETRMAELAEQYSPRLLTPSWARDDVLHFPAMQHSLFSEATMATTQDENRPPTTASTHADAAAYTATVTTKTTLQDAVDQLTQESRTAVQHTMAPPNPCEPVASSIDQPAVDDHSEVRFIPYPTLDELQAMRALVEHGGEQGCGVQERCPVVLNHTASNPIAPSSCGLSESSSSAMTGVGASPTSQTQPGIKLFIGGLRFEVVYAGRHAVRWIFDAACEVRLLISHILIHRKARVSQRSHAHSVTPTGCASVFVANERDAQALLAMHQRIYCARDGIYVAASATAMRDFMLGEHHIANKTKVRGPTHPIVVERATSIGGACHPAHIFSPSPHPRPGGVESNDRVDDVPLRARPDPSLHTRSDHSVSRTTTLPPPPAYGSGGVGSPTLNGTVVQPVLNVARGATELVQSNLVPLPHTVEYARVGVGVAWSLHFLPLPTEAALGEFARALRSRCGVLDESQSETSTSTLVTLFVGGLAPNSTPVLVSWLFSLFHVALPPGQVALLLGGSATQSCAVVQLPPCDAAAAMPFHRRVLCTSQGVWLAASVEELAALMANEPSCAEYYPFHVERRLGALHPSAPPVPSVRVFAAPPPPPPNATFFAAAPPGTVAPAYKPMPNHTL